MKTRINRWISIATLLASVVTLLLVLKRPSPVAEPQSQAAVAERAQSFDQKMAEFERQAQPPTASNSEADAYRSTESKPEVHINSEEVSAVLAQSLGTAGESRPDANRGDQGPTIKDQRVSFERDMVHGQFLTAIAGQDVWITISGHLGEKDGYATFDPTEFKVGDLDVPVSLVNPALQKKLAEQRDRLKLPDNIGSLRIQNSELVIEGR